MTLGAAALATETADNAQLERERKVIFRSVLGWAEHNRRCVLEKHPALADMCAFDGAAELRAAGPVDPTIAGSLDAWVYAEQMAANFIVRSASTDLPGVRLAYMYQTVHDTPWPAAA